MPGVEFSLNDAVDVMVDGEVLFRRCIAKNWMLPAALSVVAWSRL